MIDAWPGKERFELLRSLKSPSPAVYYVRLEQEGLSRGRVVRAWSSPVWVDAPPSPGERRDK